MIWYDIDSYIFVALSIDINLQDDEARQCEDYVVDENDANLWY